MAEAQANAAADRARLEQRVSELTAQLGAAESAAAEERDGAAARASELERQLADARGAAAGAADGAAAQKQARVRAPDLAAAAWLEMCQ